MKPSSTTHLLIVSAMLLAGWEGDAIEVGAAKLGISDGLGRPIELATGNQVFAWGDNTLGKTNVPAGLSDVVAISAAQYHTVALKQDGSVVAWGNQGNDQNKVPAGLSGVVAITAGEFHTVALKQDGVIVAWGDNTDGQTRVPAGLSGVIAVAAGYYHTVALKRNGSVVAWGDNTNGQTRVPAGLSSVVAIAAGYAHTVALKQDGSVVAWGWNESGQTKVPKGLSGVVSIAAGHSQTVALKHDGSLVAWGDNSVEPNYAPAGRSGVVAIAAGNGHTVALKQDGSVVTWGSNYAGQTNVPAGLSGVVAIAAGGGHTVALIEASGDFGQRQLGSIRDHLLQISNPGKLSLTFSISLEGSDADQFQLTGTTASTLTSDASSPFTVRFAPTRLGPMNATLKIISNDPETPVYTFNLHGTGTFNITATKPSISGSSFTHAPLRLERSTGLLLQRIAFNNTTGVSLNGLRLILSKVAPGVQVYSSSAGKLPGTFEVIYSNAIKTNETITFDLVYFDPRRRTAESMNPVIKAEALLEPELDSLPVTGTLVPLLRARSTPQGPTLEWNSAAGKTYVVEYSDDGGTTWFSAVHRLSTGGTRMFWLDRGQPETKPVGVPNQVGGRYYRVKRL